MSSPLLRPFALLPPVLGMVVLAACGKTEAPPAAPPPPPAVGVVSVAPRQVPILVEAVGRTEGSKEVEVRARVSGVLARIQYTEGGPVRAGTPLFQIDRAPFEIALAQAKAALAQERSRNEQAAREADRLKDLIAKKAISQREADDASSAFKTSMAAVQAADARVREAELNLSYTAVTAPIAGVSGRSLRSQGSLINASNDTSLLTTISQTHPIWVRFALSEPEQQVLRAAPGGGKGAEVRLVLPDGTVHPVTGKLNFAGSTVDTRLGTVQVRAEFANPDLKLLPGQFVRAQVVTGQREAILVPQSAVLQGDQGRFVWLVGPENKAQPRPVETGAWLGPDWIILKGLAAGDRVIVDNLLKIRPGVVVQPVTPGAPGAAPAGARDAAKGGSDAAKAAPEPAKAAPDAGKAAEPKKAG